MTRPIKTHIYIAPVRSEGADLCSWVLDAKQYVNCPVALRKKGEVSGPAGKLILKRKKAVM